MDNYKPNPIINKVAQADTFKKINPSNISTESPIIIRVFTVIKIYSVKLQDILQITPSLRGDGYSKSEILRSPTTLQTIRK